MEKRIIIGCDEAGRGPLAGPVYAAAVVLPEKFNLDFLNDSKKMTPSQRDISRQYIIKNALFYSIQSICAQEIDRINILNASLKAMKNAALEVISSIPNIQSDNILILVDGNRIFSTEYSCSSVIKGDSSVPEIMAASILAKTERDAYMTQADKDYPQYGFAKHKGYGTKEHYDALKKYGACPLHRKSFRLRQENDIQPTLFYNG